MTTDATRSLDQALALTNSDFELVLEFRALLLPEHLQPMVHDVWPVIRQRLEEFRVALRGEPDSIDERLQAAGLTGEELRMKLRAHRTASERAHAARPPQAGQPPISFRKFIRSLLGWIDVWLGSLVAVVGKGEAIKEFKEFLEQGVDDAENLG